jgi:hypothetical protein
MKSCPEPNPFAAITSSLTNVAYFDCLPKQCIERSYAKCSLSDFNTISNKCLQMVCYIFKTANNALCLVFSGLHLHKPKCLIEGTINIVLNCHGFLHLSFRYLSSLISDILPLYFILLLALFGIGPYRWQSTALWIYRRQSL